MGVAMRVLKWTGRGLIAVAVLFVLGAWYDVWSDHRDEAERVRFVFGRDADVPSFNPLDLFNPATMPLGAKSWYILALATAVPGLVCLILSLRRTAERG
jgi:hypothetical protein